MIMLVYLLSTATFDTNHPITLKYPPKTSLVEYEYEYEYEYEKRNEQKRNAGVLIRS